MKNNLLQTGLGIIGFLLGTLTCSAIHFTNDAVISFSNTNFEGQELVVSNCTLTIDGAHTFANLQILNGGVVRHSSAQNGMVQEIITVVDELHTFNETNSVAALAGEVNTDTIVVTDATGAVIYTNFTDYIVSTSAPFLISRTAQSNIPQDGTILVDYQATGVAAPAGMLLTITNNLEIEAGGAINLNGAGFGGGVGPGAGLSRSTNSPYVYTNGAGAGHGGYGGNSISAAQGGTIYGSVTNPITLGSGGGAGGSQGGSGGGVARITVGNAFRVDGLIAANGDRGTNSHSGGGAGGSLWIHTKEFSGTGIISANGGNGEPANGGGGGGGRIAIEWNESSFSGDVVAQGGNGWVAGGAGTVYTKSTEAIGHLTLDNRGLIGTNTAYGNVSEPYHLTLKGGAILNATNLQLRDLLIGSNSWIVPPSHSSLQITATGFAIVQTNGGIDARLKGSLSGSGPGSGYSSFSGSAGASYGGNGGRGSTNSGGNAYGSYTLPTDRGSGGGSTSMSGGGAGGTGGGAIHLSVDGTLLLNGELLADGGNGIGVNSGGGSGGSILLTVGSISGTGAISANGGSGYLPNGGGGGGGRVAVYYTEHTFSGKISAYGGSGWQNGGAGTIYLKANNATIAELLMDNGGQPGNTIIGVTNINLTIQAGAIVSNSFTSVMLNNLLVGSNGWYHQNSSALLLVASNLVIHATGRLSADGFGSSSGTGIGQSSQGIGGGGGYGGSGGHGVTNVLGGVSHGSVTMPLSFGGPGGSGYGFGSAVGGRGGGIVRVTVGRNCILNGELSSKGVRGPGANSGGGSGGSVYLTVGSLTGNGTISADGGPADLPYGGGGGGGRIAIYYTTNEFSGNISAVGGPGFNHGGAGTIYLKGSKDAFGQIVSDNGGHSGSSTTINPTGLYDLTVGNGASVVASGFSSTTIRNLLVKSNGLLTASSGTQLGFTVSGSATIERGASFIMDGSNTSPSMGQGSCSQYSSFYGYAGGGGHGGTGGMGANWASGGVSIGSLSAPTSAGGPGGSCSGTGGGGGGGGYIRLTVTSNLTVHGTLSANGHPGLTAASGGGAGGSVYLTVGNLLGSGTISANGGSGDAPYGGGGGGGRIAILYWSNQFTGNIQAYGGAGANHGGAGTIYLKANNSQVPQVIIANNALSDTGTPHPLTTLHDLTIASGARVLTTPETTYSFNHLLIRSNGWLSVAALHQLVFNLNGNAIIEQSGGIDLESRGYYDDSGFGTSRGSGGAGHAGRGGGSTGGRAYGSVASPTLPGSAVYDSPYSQGAAGGGRLQINAAGRNVHLDGEINVNGGNATGHLAGGASGGSAWLTLGSLTGTGSISANGGAGRGPTGCGGGGGRIAIHCATNQFAGLLSARGGTGIAAGGAGTIYLKIDQEAGDVLVENGGLAGAMTPLTGWTETGRLTISGGAMVNGRYPSQFLKSLTLSTNCSFVITNSDAYFDLGILENAVVDGSIILDGRGEAANTGTNSGQFNGSGSGGGHGGAGGRSASGVVGGQAHGFATTPNSRGSQGGLPFATAAYSQGGGAIRMQVGGDLWVNGGITVNGNDAIIDRSGGGAGGSIWISANTLQGTGVISADGGAGEPSDGGGGGGGRIAIYTTTNAFAGILSVAGGIGWESGKNGSLLLSGPTAPYVVSTSVSGDRSSPVSSVTFTFDSYMNAASAEISDFVINTPNGMLNATSVVAVGASGLRVNFPTQNTPGAYSIVVGPQIENVYGMPMATNHVAQFNLLPLSISGIVTEADGSPMAGFQLDITAGASAAVTDTNGFYDFTVFPGWSGSVRPKPEEGYLFVPEVRHYSSISSGYINAHFARLPVDLLNVSSSRTGTQLNVNIHGAKGVSYEAYRSTNLVNWVYYSGPFVGTNGPINVNIPTTNAPQTYIRFRLHR